MDFTTDQLEAIEHTTGNLQLIACAGSGKTEVVARRIANLLRPLREGGGGCAPGNIVAFTFTEKAAAELKERIYERVKEELGSVAGMAEMYVGTIHGYCLELLRSEVPEYMKFDVLNEVQLLLLLDRNSKQSGLELSTTLDGKPLRRFVDTKNYATAMSILREDSTFDPEELADCSVAENLRTYEQLLHKKGYLDYSAILAAAYEQLKTNNELRKRLRERVRHVVVDEYQDVNPIQESIVQELYRLGASICVVGDDDQTIYQWRGSDVRNILTFAQRYSPVKQVKLQENFRSSEGVVACARDFIARNKQRLPKAMKPTDAQDYEPGDIVALEFGSPEEEARYIAETCKQLRGVAIRDGKQDRGIDWSDMAILLRSVRRSGQTIASALHETGIPYLIAGMNNLFDQPEVEAARQLFYFLAHKATRSEVSSAWCRANLGLERARIGAALDQAEQARADMQSAGTGRFKVYNLQRQFIAFLESVGLREESVPNGRGEIVFYNLGKFSQVISDFENIHFHSEPVRKYRSFAGFLEHQAATAYPEGWQDNAFATPNAVRIMTVHQSKGMQWPVVFVPQLVKNKFPLCRPGGRTVWHLLPASAFKNQHRYVGDVEDERRLFYVAMTRSQKFLHMTWAPTPGNSRARSASEFFCDVQASCFVEKRQHSYAKRKRATPRAKVSVANVTLSFSDVKYFFECPYQFKLRILYGFNAPLDEALGFGKSLHNILAEIHARAQRGDLTSAEEVDVLVRRHLRLPFAYSSLREKLQAAAEKVVKEYVERNRDRFLSIEFSEKPIEVSLGDGISIVGRIDLVRKLDTNEVTIIDLKTNERTQAEEVTKTQLHMYALGYQGLTGRVADYVEIYELEDGKQKRRAVDDQLLTEVKRNVRRAAKALRENSLPPTPGKQTCKTCDYTRLCSSAIVG
jgi:DNA helicase-2/ATP-dependent DNA helicase PcrA